jgi:hypothetical protein
MSIDRSKDLEIMNNTFLLQRREGKEIATVPHPMKWYILKSTVMRKHIHSKIE